MRYHALLPAVLLVGLTGCSSDLTRERALSVLSQQPQVIKVATTEWREEGFHEWEMRGGKFNPSLGNGISSVSVGGVTFTPPVGRSIDVTGIASAAQANLRTVEFRWSLTNVPKSLVRLLVTEGTGGAIFAKYDDGWRLVTDSISFASSAAERSFLPRSESEQREFAEDRKNEQDRQAKAAAELLKQRELDAKMLAESHTHTKVITEFQSQWFDQKKNRFTGTLTDTDITEAGQINRPTQVWFGCIETVELQNAWGPELLYVFGTKDHCYGGTAFTVFPSEEERRRVYSMLQPALANWRAKYGAFVH